MDEGCGGKSASAEHKATPMCQVCGEPLCDRAVVQCRKCNTMHHLECWRFNKGCSMYGCGCRSSVQPTGADEWSGRGGFEIESRSVRGENPYIVAAILLLLVLGFTAGFLVDSSLMSILSLFGSIGALVYLAIRHEVARDVLHVDPERGTIRRSVKRFGKVAATEEDWLVARDVVELHLHRVTKQQGAAAWIEWKIFALLPEGKRQLVYRNHNSAAFVPTVDVRAIAERLASFADCTVREFEGKAGPSDLEIGEAVAAHQVRERAEAAPALPEASGLTPMPPVPGEVAATAEADEPPEERSRERVSDGPR